MSLVQIIKEVSSPLAPIPTDLQPVLRELSEVRVVLFDLYGTLFISGAGEIGISSVEENEETLRELLKAHFPHIKVSAEVSLSETLRSLIIEKNAQQKEQGTEHPEVVIEEIWEELLRPYAALSREETLELAVRYEAAVNPVWPMPHLTETLYALQARDLSLGIISNAQFYTPLLFPALLDQPLEDFRFSPDLCLYSYEYRRAKPSTFLFQKLSDRLRVKGISPAEVLYVGNDMQNDISPAHEVGFLTALYAGDQRSLRLRKEQNLPTPTVTITALPQLLEILGVSIL